MREITFRGKREKTGEWVDGYLIKRDEPFLHDIVVPIGNSSQMTYAIIRGTVGQYTGFKDRNEKRIFEGDVLSQQGCSDIYIVFDEKTASLGWSFTDFIRSQGYIHRINKEGMQWCKIIGNIHDHPEFLSN